MRDIDNFASQLFEEAKRFLEKAKDIDDEDGKNAFLHAALLLGISSFEAHINAISDEMAGRPSLGVLDLSILMEKAYIFKKGRFELTQKLMMYNLVDRLEYIFSNFSLPGKSLDNDLNWRGKLNQGIQIRNSLVHPKEKNVINYQNVEDTFEGILGALDAVYLALYGQHFPALGRKFDSKMEF